MTETYSFDATPNSYFMGRDLSITRKRDTRTVRVNRKGRAWAVNVKSDYFMSHRSEAVQTAASALTYSEICSLEEHAKDSFWREAETLCVAQGFGGDLYQEGRSGGWAQVRATESLESPAPNDVIEGEQDAVTRFIELAFDLDDLRIATENYLDQEIIDAAHEKNSWLACPSCHKSFPPDSYGNDGLASINHAQSGCMLGCVIGAIVARETGPVPTQKQIAALNDDYIWDNLFGPMIDKIEEMLAEAD